VQRVLLHAKYLECLRKEAVSTSRSACP